LHQDETVRVVSSPAAEGKRLPYQAIPDHLRAEIDRQLGSRVTEAVTQPGGFSPGVAARLRLANGSRAFVKAVGDINPESPDIHRAEIRIAGALPPGTPAPKLRGSIDADGWVILLLEDIDGLQPAQPWQPDELARVLAAMTELTTSLTPAPIEAPPAATRFEQIGTGWHSMAAEHSGAEDLSDVDPWIRRHLDNLVAAEDKWSAAVQGRTLAHGDTRADNILLTDDRVVFVDWPWACIGAPWFDLAAMLPSVAMQGGPPPDEVFTAHPLGREADADRVTVVVNALAGVFTYLSRLPDPPGLPTLRAFQAAQAEVAVDWLKLRTGWR